jgi:hypothetical protein
MESEVGDRVFTRLEAAQPLWVLAGPDGTLLCARHAQAGLVVLAWTTRQELENGLGELTGRAPQLFQSHAPRQRTFASLLETASRLRMRLRIDDYVVEGLEAA